MCLVTRLTCAICFHPGVDPSLRPLEPLKPHVSKNKTQLHLRIWSPPAWIILIRAVRVQTISGGMASALHTEFEPGPGQEQRDGLHWLAQVPFEQRPTLLAILAGGLLRSIPLLCILVGGLLPLVFCFLPFDCRMVWLQIGC